jgi:putative RNA 2'-phosphotransferase
MPTVAVRIKSKVVSCNVDARRGKPIVLKIEAAEMFADGQVLQQSANGVWLAEGDPACYIQFVD